MWIDEYFYLGFIYEYDSIDCKYKLINHRTLVKIFLNPLLRRLFKKAIATNIDRNGWQYIIINQSYPVGYDLSYKRKGFKIYGKSIFRKKENYHN